MIETFRYWPRTLCECFLDTFEICQLPQTIYQLHSSVCSYILNFFFSKKSLTFSTIYFVCATNFTPLPGIFPILFSRMRLEFLELLDSLELFLFTQPIAKLITQLMFYQRKFYIDWIMLQDEAISKTPVACATYFICETEHYYTYNLLKG